MGLGFHGLLLPSGGRSCAALLVRNSLLDQKCAVQSARASQPLTAGALCSDWQQADATTRLVNHDERACDQISFVLS
jgi:hypothetical protein